MNANGMTCIISTLTQHECWENGCCCTEDNVIYDENGEIVDVDMIFCCADGDDECKMYEKWIQSENESKRP